MARTTSISFHKRTHAACGAIGMMKIPPVRLYLYREYNPLSVAILQALLFLVSFMLVGVLGAVFVQLIDRQMVAFIVVSTYWIVALASDMVPPADNPKAE